METRLRKIESSIKYYHINLKDRIDESQIVSMQESVTNQFIKVADANDNEYLVRMNGKLWPPFTRSNENYNLRQLRKIKINTNVLLNDQQHGFQICRFNNKKYRFSEIENKDISVVLLKNLACQIKKYHCHGFFIQDYPFMDTINSSLQRAKKIKCGNMLDDQEVIFRLLFTLYSSSENLVASHNDLLPSSIYVDNNRVTSVVDWEYSAANFASFDLALFSIKSSLKEEQEQTLILAYDPYNDTDMSHSVTLMKPIINFLLLLWSLSSANSQSYSMASSLLAELKVNIQAAVWHSAERKLTLERRLCFFKPKAADQRQMLTSPTSILCPFR